MVMHTVIEPKILYFGSSVVLISTMNEDHTANLAPMSSAWWLNQSCILGMSSRSDCAEFDSGKRMCSQSPISGHGARNRTAYLANRTKSCTGNESSAGLPVRG